VPGLLPARQEVALLWYHKRDDERYDIEDDPLEEQNLSDRHPEKVEMFRRRIEDWLEL
jgi:hypothetical protein